MLAGGAGDEENDVELKTTEMMETFFFLRGESVSSLKSEHDEIARILFLLTGRRVTSSSETDLWREDEDNLVDLLALMAHCWDLANLSMMLSRWVVLVVFINLTGEFFLLELIFFAGDILKKVDFLIDDFFFFMGDYMMLGNVRQIVCVFLSAVG